MPSCLFGLGLDCLLEQVPDRPLIGRMVRARSSRDCRHCDLAPKASEPHPVVNIEH